MRRFGSLFDDVVSAANLWQGWREFRRGKRNRPSVRAFEPRADRHVQRLHRELASGIYRPGEYRLRAILEPKRRLVAAAPVPDRVVHHAIHRVLAPRLDRRLIDTTFACREGFGTHRAILAFVDALHRHRFVLLLDVRHYFLSIDRALLLGVMASRLKDTPLLDLLRTVAESGAGLYRRRGVPDLLSLEPSFPPDGCGLPIGNLTSQWWGNHYLDGFDHFVKRQLKVPHYQRYMDDLALFADSAPSLEKARDAAREWLWKERHLNLKNPAARPRSTQRIFTYLGYRVSRAGAWPTLAIFRRMQRRLTGVMLRGKTQTLERSIASYRGILEFGSGCQGR